MQGHIKILIFCKQSRTDWFRWAGPLVATKYTHIPCAARPGNLTGAGPLMQVIHQEKKKKASVRIYLHLSAMKQKKKHQQQTPNMTGTPIPASNSGGIHERLTTPSTGPNQNCAATSPDSV